MWSTRAQPMQYPQPRISLPPPARHLARTSPPRSCSHEILPQSSVSKIICNASTFEVGHRDSWPKPSLSFLGVRHSGADTELGLMIAEAKGRCS